MSEESIGIRRLRNTLSATLERVKAGEIVTVTDRNRPVAVIVPAPAQGSIDRLRMLDKVGVLAWSGGKPRGLAGAPAIEGPPVSDAVIEDRR